METILITLQLTSIILQLVIIKNLYKYGEILKKNTTRYKVEVIESPMKKK